MRVPLAVNLESRDGTVTKDAKTLNAILEVSGKKLKMRKRPGMSDQGLIRAGVAQLLTYWNSQFVSVIDDYLNANTALLATHATTWNSADKGADITLSNGDLTATWVSNLAYDAVRTTTAKTSGWWYWENTLGASASVGIGVANTTDNVDDATAGFTTANAMVYISSAGTIIHNNVTVQSGLSTATTADVIGVLYSIDLDTVQFYKNGVAIGTAVAAANLPTGVLYPYLTSNSTFPVVTSNFGATAFVYAPTLTAYSLGPTTADLPFSGQDNGANAPTPYLMVKNAQQAWTLNVSGTVAQITDVDYPGTYAVTLTSLTRSGTTATASVASDVNFQVGSTVVIAGATPSDYNGSKIVTGVTSSVSTSTEPIAVTITRSGATATATVVSETHPYVTGNSVTISGAGQAAYNGTFTVTRISATQFSFTVTVTSSLTSPATGTLVYSLTLSPGAFFFALGMTGTISSNVATVTAPGHGWSTGRPVNGMALLDGVWTTFAATTITVTGANTFTFAFTHADALTAVPFRVYPGAAAITSITASGAVATVTTTSAHHFDSFVSTVTISGAAQSYYNVSNATPTVTGTTTFTYPITDGSVDPVTPATGTISSQINTTTGASFTFTVTGSPATPATGTITATGGRNTVPGIAYMDGFFVVMDVFGVLYNSAEDDPATWNALEYVAALAETGLGKAIARSGSYIVAFKEYSTEFFFTDPQNEVGSPFSAVPHLFTKVGCANGFSLADVAGKLLWIAQSKKQKGRSVYIMDGAEQAKVSTPGIDRILDSYALTSVNAFGVTLQGHPLYVLNLVTAGITLVYDLASKAWGQWTSLTLGASKSVTSITRSGTTATVTFGVAHTLSDGDPVLIAGANQSDYNGIFQVSYVSTTVVTIEVANSPATPATGTITGKPYTETYFKFPCYASGGGTDALLHESDGHIYYLSDTLYRDAGLPINEFARGARLDLDTLHPKKNPRISVVATSVSDTAMIRWSDDDCATFLAYRRATLSDEEPMIRRNGAFKRRTFELRYIGNTAPVMDALELEIV